ncbi:MAG: hypothetical protein ACPG4X_16805 [Pikeienuella sp.]
MQFDEHVIVLHSHNFRRVEVIQNAALSGLGVNAVPYGLAGLLVLRKAMPVCADFPFGQRGNAVQDNLVFARAPMPNRHEAVMRAIYKRLMKVLLIPPNPEVEERFTHYPA